MDGSPGVTVDEEPVAEDVDEVRGNERHGDGANVIEGLQVAAQGEVKEEDGCSPVEGAEEGCGAEEDLMVDGQAHHSDGREGDEAHEDGCEDGCEDEAVEEPAVGFVEFARSVGLGEVSVKAEEDPGDAEAECVVEDLTEGGGGDVEGRVGHVADHHGVGDAHRHPAKFGEDERESEGEHGPDLLAYGHRLPPLLLSLLHKVFKGKYLAAYLCADFQA